MGFLLAGNASSAADRYQVDVPAFVMAGDPDVVVSVTPLQSGTEDTTFQKIKFMGLPSGVTVEPSGGGDFVLTGRGFFRVIVSPDAVPQRVVVKVQNASKSQVSGMAWTNIERTVARFGITPFGDKRLVASVPFPFQIVAFDKNGAVVASFNDPVRVAVSQGVVEPVTVEGVAFKKGVARVDVIFSQQDALQTNRFEVSADRLYPGQTERARGEVELQVGAAPTP